MYITPLIHPAGWLCDDWYPEFLSVTDQPFKVTESGNFLIKESLDLLKIVK